MLYNDDIKFHDDSANMRFIPVTQQELVKGLLAERASLEKDEREVFHRFSELLQAVYHTRYFERYESLKKYYQPFNPDQDVTTLERWSDDDKKIYQKHLFSDMKVLLKKANYNELNESLINEALSNEVSRNLSIDVEMEDFEQVLIFVRGHSVKETKQRHWRTLFLLKTKQKELIYRRLCIVFRFRTEDSLRECLKNQGMGRFTIWRHILHYRKVVESESSQQYIFMRLFRDVPRSDLQMLFPNSKLHFTLFDTVKLSVSGGAGILGGLWAMFAKLALAIKPLAILMALASFIGIIGRNISNVLSHQTNYQMVLSRSLYSHSLDINIGVASALVDQAKDEDLKESLLAYYFILKARKKGMTLAQLDSAIEKHLMLRYGVFVDFEVDDAVLKLKHDGFVAEDADGLLTAISVREACEKLMGCWEDIFSAARRLALLDGYQS